jgi:hypothetical protein
VADKVEVFDCATGASLLRWPVDARELVASGAYAFTPPAPVAAEPAPAADDEPEAHYTSRSRKRR